MFQGYSDETFEFFMALRFNNNRDFFHQNHDWYLRSVREPSLMLAEALAPTIEWLDPNLERRPNRVVSRINRDLRFSNDKSPYRDYIWLGFRPPKEEREEASKLGVFFDFSDSGASYGMGLYGENRPLMNGLRRRILTEPETLLAAWKPVRDEFQPFANAYKRMAVPEQVPEELRAFYPIKGLYFQKELNDFALLKSPALADEIIGGLRRLAPLYRYLAELKPETDGADNTITRL